MKLAFDNISQHFTAIYVFIWRERLPVLSRSLMIVLEGFFMHHIITAKYRVPKLK